MIKRVFGQMVLIELEKETEDTVTLDNGTELFLDTEIERMWHARQHGIVAHVAPHSRKRVEDNIELKKGDKVYFHHFVIDKTLSYGEERFYQADINQIYAVERNGEITMLQDYIFVEPVTNADSLKTESGIITGTEEYLNNEGVVTHLNQFTKNVIDLNIGDRIVFQQNANYKIKVQGKDLYRMRDYDAICVK